MRCHRCHGSVCYCWTTSRAPAPLSVAAASAVFAPRRPASALLRPSVALCRESARDLRARLPSELRADVAPGFEHQVEVDAGMYREAVEQIHHILGGDIARGALGVGTAAEAGDRT